MKSWAKYFPDYQIKCWGINSFDFQSVRFTREALAARKWAFVADYIRLYALYTEGGVYLDSDVMAFGSIEEWLKYDLFTGIEKRGDTSDLFVEAAIMGAAKENPTIKKCLDIYSERQFVLNDGTFNLTPIPTLITPVFCQNLGWKRVDETQELANNSVVFSSKIIANTESVRRDTVVLYHCNNKSWIDRTLKEKLYELVRKLGLMPIWNLFKGKK